MTTAITTGQELDPAALNGASNAGTTTVQNAVSGGGTTTSTTYTATLTGSTGAAIAFVAPPTGRVLIAWSSGLYNAGAAQDAWCSWELRSGSSIGGGSVVGSWGATDDRALRLKTASVSNDVQFGDVWLVDSLTPGDSYHVRQMFKVSGSTGTFARKKILVTPAH